MWDVRTLALTLALVLCTGFALHSAFHADPESVDRSTWCYLNALVAVVCYVICTLIALVIVSMLAGPPYPW